MLLQTKNIRKYFITSIMGVMVFCVSCKEDNTNAVDFPYDPETVPTANTDSVTVLISDSGLIRYKILAKTWMVFEQAKDPHWLYPEGFYAEQFDTTFTVVAVVKSDTAWNYTKRKLFVLRGHVSIVNSLGEKFTSEELFWDQRSQTVYSDKYVEVDRPGKVLLRARGFKSNQQMTDYSFSGVHSTKLYVNEENEDNKEKIE